MCILYLLSFQTRNVEVRFITFSLNLWQDKKCRPKESVPYNPSQSSSGVFKNGSQRSWQTIFRKWIPPKTIWNKKRCPWLHSGTLIESHDVNICYMMVLHVWNILDLTSNLLESASPIYSSARLIITPQASLMWKTSLHMHTLKLMVASWVMPLMTFQQVDQVGMIPRNHQGFLLLENCPGALEWIRCLWVLWQLDSIGDWQLAQKK